MSLLSELRERARAPLFRLREERDLEEELRVYVEMAAEENLRRGMTRKEARRQPHVKRGGVEQTKEDVRRARGTRWLEDLASDLRLTLRTRARRLAPTTHGWIRRSAEVRS